MNFTKIAVSGTSSESGKTTLMCQLLKGLRHWEAIKMTRGHYRSCGKDPHACCVSHLLGNEPLIRSGFLKTYVEGKDTGRYWEAGASNVHWVVVTDDQVERGLQLALDRVRAPGVLIEGNTFLKYFDVDFSVLVLPTIGVLQIKGSTRWAFAKASALYTLGADAAESFSSLVQLKKKYSRDLSIQDLTVYEPSNFSKLLGRIRRLHRKRTLGHCASRKSIV